MAENNDNLTQAPDLEGKDNTAPTAATLPEEEKHFVHTEIKGHFNQYQSGFWGLAIPMLSARYTGRFVSYFFDLAKEKNSYFVRRLYGFYVGAVMTVVTAFYAKRTWEDMKHIFSETLGYEFNKKPEEIGFRDFWKSQNSIVHRTLMNVIKYNTRRAIFVNLPFLNFLIPGVLKKTGSKFGVDIYQSVDLGVGTTGAYLATDAISRKETFFEGMQRFIDQKINHVDRAGDTITAADLITLYDRHAKDRNPNYTYSGRMDTQRWKNDQRLFDRIALLMNQTYGNEPNTEKVNFTVPKLIFLLGNGLIDPEKVDRSLAYIEIASRSAAMDEVKKLAKALAGGASLEEATQGLTPAARADTAPMQPPENKHTRKLAPAQMRGHAEKIVQEQGNNSGLSRAAV